jgi:hypothetical protein
MQLTNWYQIRPRNAPGVVLAVDFMSGRDEPDLAQFTDRLALPYTTLGTLAPEAVPHGDPTAYVNCWHSEIVANQLQVHAVLGHCASASFAIALTARLTADASAAGTAPPLALLLNPEAVNLRMFHWQFVWAIEPFVSYLPEMTIEKAHDIARRCAESNGPDLGSVGLVLCREFRALISPAFHALDLDETATDEMCERFESYMSYLTAAWRLSSCASSVNLAMFLTTDHDAPDGLAGDMQIFDVPAAELLVSTGVASAAEKVMRLDQGL